MLSMIDQLSNKKLDPEASKMLAELKKKTNKNKKVLLKEVDSQDEFTESLTEESREASE